MEHVGARRGYLGGMLPLATINLVGENRELEVLDIF